ncbi:MAG: DUF4093 domain-containing protein [Clostridia bacterium]|nr:DUF4093 domain-containing protein [Clostridia bacterium]
MLHTTKAVIVEGRYDKARLSGIIDALIITTDGFGIFNSKEKQTFIKKLALEKGLIILTDSDAAGFKIRNFLKNIVPENRIVHAYIPDIYGKEKRKETPSKEGKLGVEGIDNSVIEQALLRTGLFSEVGDNKPSRSITSADLFEKGLSGGENSAERRRKFLLSLGLPARLTGKNLLQLLNSCMTYDDFQKKAEELFSD